MVKTLEFIGTARSYVAGRLKFTPDSRRKEVTDEEAKYLLSRLNKAGKRLFRSVGEVVEEAIEGQRNRRAKAKEAARIAKTAKPAGPAPEEVAKVTKGFRVGAFLNKSQAIEYAATLGVTLDKGLAIKTMNAHTKELAKRAAAGLTGAKLVKGLSGTNVEEKAPKEKLPNADAPVQLEEVEQDESEEAEEDDEGLVDLVPKVSDANHDDE